MTFTAQYIDSSLYYLPWKTKFIEAFCIPYAHMKRLLLSYNNDEQRLKEIVHIYLTIFQASLKILQKRLKYDHNIDLNLNLDIIHFAEKEGLISDKKMFYEALYFYSKFKANKANLYEFKFEYIKIMEDFSNTFKTLTKTSGFCPKDYVIYDNSYCLWGIKEKYYIDLVKLFLAFDKLKIVRIFGSRVTQEYKEFSDLDLICEGTYSAKGYKDMLEKFQQHETPYVIDMYDIKRGRKPFLYRNLIRSNIFYMRKNYITDNYMSLIDNDFQSSSQGV